jgi:hypothetical protein
MPALLRGRSIADLIRMRGDIAAEREMESGNIWGGALPGIASTLNQGLGQYLQGRQESKQWQDYARAYDDYLKIMRPGGIGF